MLTDDLSVLQCLQWGYGVVSPAYYVKFRLGNPSQGNSVGCKLVMSNSGAATDAARGNIILEGVTLTGFNDTTHCVLMDGKGETKFGLPCSEKQEHKHEGM